MIRQIYNLIVFSALFLFSGQLWSQEPYTGLITDNYLGMTSVHIQPADIVDNRYKFQLGLSTNLSSSNNYNALNFNNLLGFTKHPRNEYRNHNRGGFNNVNTSLDLINVMFEYQHKNAFGYNLSFKTFNINSGLPQELTFANFNDFLNNPTATFDYENLSMQSMSYIEHGFHYGRIIKEDNEHYLKAGTTLKLINGLDANYFFSQSGQMTFTSANGNNLSLTNTGDPIEFGRVRPGVGTSGHRLGFGFDLGAVYEYRPEYKKFRYNMDGERNIPRYDVNKYLYKIGISITNIGSVKFLKDTNTYDFNANGVQLAGTSFFNVNNNGFDNATNALFQPEATKASSDEDSYRMSLPAALNLQFDYNVYKNFYAAFTGSVPLGFPSNANRVKHTGMYSIIPRYETKKWAITLPLSIKGNGQFMMGATARVSSENLSVFVGSNAVTYLVGKRKIYDGSFFAGVSIGLPHSIPDDYDGDEVSDQKDRCPFDPGPWELKGCPDTDNDGIIDLEDHCIYDQGKKENNGCPDRDGDGVIDVNDHCPDDAGLAVHYGCPDRDKDGVIDVADRCPDVPGIELNNGCPFENQGCCSDNDGDGIANEVDECPDVAGSVYNKGCPIDSTNINTINLQEVKPEIDPNHTNEQIQDNPIEKEDENGGFDPVQINSSQNLNDLTEGKQIDRLVVNFKTDQSFIEANYVEEINDLLKKTKALKKENIHFVIVGHTDTDGGDDYNLILSRKRAETVRKHLMNKGIDFDRIQTYYYGEWKPLNSGNNETDKRINRRVEIIVIQK